MLRSNVWCRNRKDNGNPTLVAQIARHFNLPAAMAPPGGNQAFQFSEFIYLTQASHSLFLARRHCLQLLASALHILLIQGSLCSHRRANQFYLLIVAACISCLSSVVL